MLCGSHAPITTITHGTSGELQVDKCMNEVLLNDEDMALMYLTDRERERGKARDPRQHQEIEMLFENYLLQVGGTNQSAIDRSYSASSVYLIGLKGNLQPRGL